MAKKYDDSEGKWVTLKSGLAVCIKPGQSLGDAIKQSGTQRKENVKQKGLNKLKEKLSGKKQESNVEVKEFDDKTAKRQGVTAKEYQKAEDRIKEVREERDRLAREEEDLAKDQDWSKEPSYELEDAGYHRSQKDEELREAQQKYDDLMKKDGHLERKSSMDKEQLDKLKGQAQKANQNFNSDKAKETDMDYLYDQMESIMTGESNDASEIAKIYNYYKNDNEFFEKFERYSGHDFDRKSIEDVLKSTPQGKLDVGEELNWSKASPEIMKNPTGENLEKLKRMYEEETNKIKNTPYEVDGNTGKENNEGNLPKFVDTSFDKFLETKKDRKEYISYPDWIEQQKEQAKLKEGYNKAEQEKTQYIKSKSEEYKNTKDPMFNDVKKERQDDYDYNLYVRARMNPDSIDPMTENSTDWEDLDRKYKDRYEKEQANLAKEMSQGAKKTEEMEKENLERAKKNGSSVEDLSNRTRRVHELELESQKAEEYANKMANKKYATDYEKVKGVKSLSGELEKDNKGRVVSQKEYDEFRQAYKDGKISKEDYRNDNYDALKKETAPVKESIRRENYTKADDFRRDAEEIIQDNAKKQKIMLFPGFGSKYNEETDRWEYTGMKGIYGGQKSTKIEIDRNGNLYEDGTLISKNENVSFKNYYDNPIEYKGKEKIDSKHAPKEKETKKGVKSPDRGMLEEKYSRKYSINYNKEKAEKTEENDSYGSFNKKLEDNLKKARTQREQYLDYKKKHPSTAIKYTEFLKMKSKKK